MIVGGVRADELVGDANLEALAGPGEWVAYDPVAIMRKWAEGASHKEICAEVRVCRGELKAARLPSDRLHWGKQLYQYQVALRTRFGIDIAKVRD